MVRRLIWTCSATLWLGLAQAAPPPIADFFKTPDYQEPRLSPDGKQLAVIIGRPDGHNSLAVVKLEGPRKAKVIAGFADADVADIHWVNNHRLVYDARDGKAQLTDKIWPGLWAIDSDGENERRLVFSNRDDGQAFGTNIKDRTLPWNWVLHSTLDDGSDDVLIEFHQFDPLGQPVGTSLARLDTRSTTKRIVVEQTPAHAREWWTDTQGKVTAVWTENQGRSELLVPEGSGWRSLSKGDYVTGEGQRFVPLQASVPGWLFVRSPDPEGRVDTEVLARLDLNHPDAPPKVLLSLPGYDFLGELVVDGKAGKLVGVKFQTDAESAVWFDARMKAAQAEIDQKLPDTVNQISCHACASDEVVLVSSSSDRQPPFYSIYEVSAHKLTTLLNSRPWIAPAQMGRREMASYKSRDGLSIPLVVTHPPGPPQPKRPAVVLVHGGPWVRGNFWADWQQIEEAQFLASRGYVVIEPEFRGSMGYGYKLFRAGFKQWGLAMQDDISDAMDFAVAKGWIDAKRVCIAGASYGGYATLMGLAKEPERYRCGFEWVGVTDINLMYSISWSDSSSELKEFEMPVRIGDPAQDAAQLKATSPIQLASRINKPLLMGYGAEDRRVPIDHGVKFRDAVKAHNADVEWVVYQNEGHGWLALASNVDFWGRAEKLLARTIGDGAKPGTP